MEYTVRLTPRAAQDAENIYRRIQEEAPVRGQEWHNRLIEALDSLSEFPERCQIDPALSRSGSQIRRLLYGRRRHVYRIYFDVVGTTVRILHIRHGARRSPNRKDIFD